MSDHYCAFDHEEWDSAGLKDYGDFAECVSYVNQREYGDGSLAGGWYYCDDETRTIYSGSFGNDNSPGASMYTYADVYGEEEADEYAADKARWDAKDEYLETEEEEDEEDCEAE